MRYYDLTLTPPGSSTPARRWTSHPNGKFDPGALNIEVDAPVGPYGLPMGGATVLIHGVSLQDLSQVTNWGIHWKGGKLVEGMYLRLEAGMKAGLPLANPRQAGVILAGQVIKSYGNWEGTEQDVALIVQPANFSPERPGNLVLNWQKGMTLATALRNCLQIAYPDLPMSVHLSERMTLNYQQVHAAHTLEGLASWVAQFTRQTFGDEVVISIQAGQLIVFDSSYETKPKPIVFEDLIGQPAWIDFGQMQAKFAMRADLMLGDTIHMPQGAQSRPGFVLTSSQAWPSAIKQKTTFAGQFKVRAVRHIGNFRAPDGASWVTVVNALEWGVEQP